MTDVRTQDQFLAAFNDIENYLKRVVYGGRDVGNRGLVETLDKFTHRHRTRLRREQVETLKALAAVRNLMSHSKYFEGRLPVDPTPTTVAVVQQIREHLISPPKALQVLGTQTPTTIEPGLIVSEALKLMHNHDYSQLPVYENSSYVGLLTNNAIGRWVADQMHRLNGLVEDAPVSDVLHFSEEPDRVVHVSRDITAADAVARFAESAEKGTPVTALIVTQAGKPSETPLSIIVSADLPRLAA